MIKMMRVLVPSRLLVGVRVHTFSSGVTPGDADNSIRQS